ncbi:unnamed protein product [Cyprideis torosa]|uniref:Uncharacterized protein n=1 Tax=Cyprideis torosa TaxID=163714 RepID=A0A7R8ZHQ6_9CRUS|nr:unnamed protein product [Cyprideis torosa]CAG0883041.1 unnamed protein product [Cyprideis torosa]
MVSVRIPLNEEEVTSEWFAEALSNTPTTRPAYRQNKVVSMELSPMTRKLGFMTTHLRGNLVLDPEGDVPIFVKLVPQDPMFVNLMRRMRFDLNEVRFYDTLLPDFQRFIQERGCQNSVTLQVPEPVLVLADSEKPESILVLRDMGADGYKTMDFTKDWTLPMLQAAARTLATIHAVSYAFFEELGLETVLKRYPFMTPPHHTPGEEDQVHFQHVLQLIMQTCIKDDVEFQESLIEICKRTEEHVEEIFDQMKTGHPESTVRSLKQSDSWNNNYIVKKDSDGSFKMILVDWQWPFYGTAISDLTSLLYTSTSAEIRKIHTDEVLKEYRMTFNQTLKYLDYDKFEYTTELIRKDYNLSHLGVFYHLLMLSIAFTNSARQQPGGEAILVRYREALREMLTGGLVHEGLDKLEKR